jgi:hypothetical protein
MEKSSIVEEETGGRRSRGSGVGTSEGFPEENKGLHEVTKSDFIPDRWIWKETWQRSTHFRGGTLRRKFKRRTPEELGSEVILAIHRGRTCGKRSTHH